MLAACQSDFAENAPAQSGDDDGMLDVGFDIYVDPEMISRASDGGRTIGKGSKINQLIYAVYLDEVSEESYVDDQGVQVTVKNHVYTLLTQYGNNDYGQHVVDFENGLYNLTIRLKKNQEYALVFWLQNKDIDAYDTSDFRCVQINYDNCKANDDALDAFAKVESMSVGSVQLSSNRSVYLSRPFAQINVGTTGKDYNEYIAKNGAGSDQLFSKIYVKGVACFMDVLLNKVLTPDDYEEYLEDPQSSPYYNKLKDLTSADQMLTDVTFETAPISDLYISGKEEFLKVKINDDNTEPLKRTDVFDEDKDGFLDYKTTGDMQAVINNTTYYLTETFKYLSMCYVLVPAPIIELPDYSGSGNGGNVDSNNADNWGKIEQITYSLYAPNESSLVGEQSINAVPVRRNWRSNIIGGLETTSSVFTTK